MCFVSLPVQLGRNICVICKSMSDLARDIVGLAVRLSVCNGVSVDRDYMMPVAAAENFVL